MLIITITIFLLGALVGIALFLASPLLVAEHDFPDTSQLDFVTMIPCERPAKLEEIQNKTVIAIDEQNRDALFASFRLWNSKQRALPFYVTIKGRCYRLYNRVPTDDAIRKYQIQHDDPPITIYSDGYQPLESLHCGPIRSILKMGSAVPGILVSVNYPCDLWWRYRQFNYCQEQDVKTLRLSIDVLVSKTMDSTKFVLCGGSKGALTTLHCLASLQEEHPRSTATHPLLNKRIMCALAFCPITDFITSSHGMGFGGRCLRFWCPRLMPNYRTKPKQLTDTKAFPNIPLFVSSLQHDTFVPLETVNEFLDHLVKIGLSPNNLHQFVSKESLPHGQVGKDPEHTKALQRFFAFCQSTT